MSPLEPASRVVAAPAKLTLSLRLLHDVRPDGLHTIDAEMVALDFGDELSIVALDQPDAMSDVRFEGEVAHAPGPEDDLVSKALHLVGRAARVTVRKRIPSGAGLGGGSADAAAILRWAGFADLERAAFELGADVAFCMIGGRARVRGIGELVDPLRFEPLVVTLLTPPLRCPTAAVYRAWDQLGPHEVPGDNDLELAALSVVPELASWRDALAEASGKTPQLAGSGSTWFVPGSHPGDGRVVARTIPPDS